MRASLFAAAVSLTAGTTLAKPRVLVTPFDEGGAPLARAAEHTAFLIDRINAAGDFDAVDLMGLNELSTALAGCKDFACEAQLAGVGAIDALVGGTIAYLQGNWVLSLHRVEVPSGRIQQRVVQLVDRSAPEAMLAAIDGALPELFAPAKRLAKDAPRVLLLDVEVDAMAPEVARAITEIALAEATAHGSHAIKSQRDTEEIVALAECTSGCDDLRREAALDFLLILRLAKMGDSILITSKLLQLHGTRVLGRLTATLEADAGLLEPVAKQIAELLALAPARPEHGSDYIARDPKKTKMLKRTGHGSKRHNRTRPPAGRRD